MEERTRRTDRDRRAIDSDEYVIDRAMRELLEPGPRVAQPRVRDRPVDPASGASRASSTIRARPCVSSGAPCPVLVLALCAGPFVPRARAGDSGPHRARRGTEGERLLRPRRRRARAQRAPGRRRRRRREGLGHDGARRSSASWRWGGSWWPPRASRACSRGPPSSRTTASSRLGAAALAAYEQEFGGAAAELLASGIDAPRPDPPRARGRAVPAHGGRPARGPPDRGPRARGRRRGRRPRRARAPRGPRGDGLPRPRVLARPYRAARLAREAVARARTSAALPRVRAWLEAPDDDAAPRRRRLPPPLPLEGLADGGGRRVARARARGARREARLLEHRAPARHEPSRATTRRETGGAIGNRPSPWLPAARRGRRRARDRVRRHGAARLRPRERHLRVVRDPAPRQHARRRRRAPCADAPPAAASGGSRATR